MTKKSQEFRFFVRANLIVDRKKYFTLHIPDKLGNMLGIKVGAKLDLYVSTKDRAFYARVVNGVQPKKA